MVIAYMRIVMGESQFTKVFDGGSERGKREIIWRAGKIAEKNPDAFDKGMRDESTINKHYILTGIDQTYLTLDEMYNTIRITSNNMLLQQAPKGVNVVDLFIDNVKRGESKSLMQLALKEMKVIKESESVVVTGVKAGEKAPTPKEVKEIGGKPESDFISGVTKQEAISLMEGAIEAQPPILTLSPPSHYHYKKGTDEQKYFLGKSKILDALASDPAFVVVLQDAVHKAALNPA
jgi:hypothetical protein